jgi:hypothetical protein
MRTFVHDTDSSDVQTQSVTIKFGLPDRRANETYARYRETGDLDLGFESRSLESVLKLKLGLDNSELAQSVRGVLAIIIETLEAYKYRAIELPPLPPLHAYTIADGTLLLEWFNEHYRIGFAIGPSVKESSWYIVSDDTMGSLNASGLLSGDGLKGTVMSLVGFVLANS